MNHLIKIAFLVLLISSCSDNSKTNSNAILTENVEILAIDKKTLSKLTTDFSAHWLSQDLIMLPNTLNDNAEYFLVLKLEEQEKYQLQAVKLTKIITPKQVFNQFPHLASFQAFTVKLSSNKIKLLLKQQVFIVQYINNLATKKIYLQSANIIDDLYTSGKNNADEVTNFGATITDSGVQFKLWAPTAQQVSLLLFLQSPDGQIAKIAKEVAMTEDKLTGVWSTTVDSSFNNAFYQYKIKLYHPVSKQVETLITTDPYSLSLSTNSQHSHVIDLNNESTKPEGWHQQQDVIVGVPENNIFYETHIRDFSAHDPQLSSSQHRGKYKAFTEKNSAGIKHLKLLQQAGINNIHLLPTFDIGTINEVTDQTIDINDPISKVCQLASDNSLCDEVGDQQQTLANYLASLPATSSKQQAIISSLKALDNYNWGYDPFHYTVPEGSYAIKPQGSSRIVEFREMVQSIHNLGFRVIMDVVYNHTHQAGLEPTAVLDKIVPNYYHRLNPITGKIAQSTCCDNTATEQVMMEKLMIDSLVVWARDYKIDGFRFDLMAHQPKASMIKARQAVEQVDEDTYFYGEGWNFGEVANNQRFIQASQLELSGTEIGTFTDRLRDAVRGGAFTASGDQLRQDQGLGNGLVTSPNELQTPENSTRYALMMDQLRIGLAGNLANFPLLNALNQPVLGKDIPYGSQPAGYALDPADTINYISKHDNQTLWDNNQYRLPYNTSTKDRVRYHLQALSFPILAQGIPFLHMGSELLRSKSFLRDSYDYGDWFNKVDFTMQSNNYNVGLPPAEKDQGNWLLIKELLDKNEQRDIVSSDDIRYSAAVFNEWIKIRMSSPLFRLTTAGQIIKQVKFNNTGKSQQQGLIVMSISQPSSKDNSQEFDKIVVLFNTEKKSQNFSFKGAENYRLHPVQQQGIDKIVQQSLSRVDTFVIPALTTAVFVL